MKMKVDSPRLIKLYSNSFNFICLFLLIQAGEICSRSTKCPFQLVYHFGDGITDIGNSILVQPSGSSNPAASFPYGQTYPGYPTGRWSDGLIDFDFAASDFGVPNIVPYLKINTPINSEGFISSVTRNPVLDDGVDFGVPHITSYLSKNASNSYDGVIFSVARSPVLDRSFLEKKGIFIPEYAVPLVQQIQWFKAYLKSICSTPTACANLLQKSLVLMGDIEGNDVGYALTQGKSIRQVKHYIDFVINQLVKSTKDLIKMGATLIIIPGNAPIGCYPYILTALATNDSRAYDELGCLRDVNNLILLKNKRLQKKVEVLNRKYPHVTILFGNFYEGVIKVLRDDASSGCNILKACCGIGGKYNYDSKRFCGSYGVPVCGNPNEYIFWDGLHLTQEAYHRIEQFLIKPTLRTLKCKSSV